MDSLLSALGVLLLSVFVFGAVISAILWFSYKDAVYRKMVLFWLANVGQMLLLQGVQKASGGSLVIEGAVSLSWIGLTMMPVLISIVQDLNDDMTLGKGLVRMSFVGVAATVLTAWLTGDFLVATSVGCLLAVFPLLLVLIYLQFFNRERRRSPILSGFNITTMLLLLHFLDYPFLRTVATFAPYGFTIYVGISIGLVVFMQGGMVERSYLSNAESLEKKVRERTHDLEAFSYSVSHDLRAPIRAILGFAGILRESSVGKLDDTGVDAVDRIASAASRMSKLIDGLLELSRLGRTELKVAPVNLTATATQILNELHEGEPGRKIESIIGSGLVAEGDGRLLRVVLDNLLRNAWKYSRHAVPAVIEFGSEAGEGKQVIYFVKDNGVGFDMSHSGQLFQPFQRLHSEKEFEGTGIGLATAHRIITRHGGKIWAAAKIGEGARFSFTIPGPA